LCCGEIIGGRYWIRPATLRYAKAKNHSGEAEGGDVWWCLLDEIITDFRGGG